MIHAAVSAEANLLIEFVQPGQMSEQNPLGQTLCLKGHLPYWPPPALLPTMSLLSTPFPTLSVAVSGELIIKVELDLAK